MKLTGGKTHPSVGQAPNLWKVCAEVNERTEAPAIVNLIVATIIAVAVESQLAEKRPRRKETC